MSPGFRLHRDAAAQGILPDAAGIADAAAVPAPDLAATVAWNYGSRLEDLKRFEGLQEWGQGAAEAELAMSDVLLSSEKLLDRLGHEELALWKLGLVNQAAGLRVAITLPIKETQAALHPQDSRPTSSQ